MGSQHDGEGSDGRGRASTAATGSDTPRSSSLGFFRRVGTPLKSASKFAGALVGGFLRSESGEWDASKREEDAEADGAMIGGTSTATKDAIGRIAVLKENGASVGGERTMGTATRFASEANARSAAVAAARGAERWDPVDGTESPTPFTEIKEFLRRGQLDRERMLRPETANAVLGATAVGGGKPQSTFEREAAQEAQETPVRERATPPMGAATTPVGGAAATTSPGYASVRRSYGASGTPSLLGTRGRTAARPAILEPAERAPTPPRTSLKRERELTFVDLERERARVTTPRRLESQTHSPGPGALARDADAAAYQTPASKPVTSAVTTDTAKRILQTLDRLAGARTATPMGATASKPSSATFATRPADRSQITSPVVGSAFDKPVSATKVTPTSATFVQTPKSGVSFAASPMPFISSSASGRAPNTPYPTGADRSEPEIETPDLKFKFGEDSNLLATGKKPRAPAGPVANVTTKFTFGEGASAPLFPKKSSPVKTSPPPPPAPVAAPVAEKKAEAAPGAKPTVNLWSAEFLAKNQEHQKKVQAAIEEEENAAQAPAPSPFAAAPPAGEKPAFSFGIPAASSAPAASSSGGFSFGVTAPAASGASEKPAFSFGVTAPAKPAEAEKPKTGGESGLLAFLGASSEAKTAEQPASAPTFTFGAPPKSPENAPEKAPEPAPAFTFGGSSAPAAATEKEKPASTPAFSFGATPPSAAPAASAPAAAPFSFGAKPAEKTEPKKEEKSQLSATAAPFTFGAKSDDKPASAPAFTFGASAPAKTEEKPASEAPKPAFSFGATPAAKEDSKPAGGFTFGAAAASAPASSGASESKPASTPAFTFGGASSAAADAKPASAPAFSFGAASSAPASGASSGFTFGGAASAPASSGAGAFTFGASSSAPAASNPFGGGLSVNTKPSESVFGQSKQDEQPNTPEPMSPFETSKTPTATSGGGVFGSANASSFGAPAATSAPAANPFGGGGANPFGGSSGASANPFGGSSGASANPFGGASSTPAFGGSAGANPFGGASGGSSAPAFGAAPAAGNPFGGGGSAAPAPTATPNPFGGSAAPGGFSMGGGGAPAEGGRKPPRKFRRPPKR
jgi:nucleoporin NUP1